MDDFESLGFASSAAEDPLLPSFGIVEFNAEAYLHSYADASDAIASGEADSALDHYLSVGRPERRLEAADYILQLAGGCEERPAHGQLSFNIEAFLMSESGFVFVVGWSDDRANALLSVSVVQDREGFNSRAIARCRRQDAEQALGFSGAHPFGFWLLDHAGLLAEGGVRPGLMLLRARFADGRFSQVEMAPRIASDTELRETALGHFASLSYLGNRDIEAFRQLDLGAGVATMALNRRMSTGVTGAAYIERFGPQRERFSASFIVCLFGKVEYFFLQNALFATGKGVADIEFVYVLNSPELAESLHKEARIAERIYGLTVTLVTLPDNAGFSAANNVAARAARSGRLVFINPDVFPRDDNWAQLHGAIIEDQPSSATTLFGAPLYYDDGSLMHGGMYFEIDKGLSVKSRGIESETLIRVEHYGKGAPAWSDVYSATRPVPAVTGAFISVDRDWFERLGGFNESFVFGHYEDADLCLNSLEAGVPAWLQNVRFWHLEGKGSVRRPVHEGGSLVNRWYFTRKWGNLIQSSLSGRKPSHALLQADRWEVPKPARPAASAPAPAAGSRLKTFATRLSRGDRS